MGLLWLSNLQANLTVEKFFEHLGRETDKLVFYLHGTPKIEHTITPLCDEPEHYRTERFIFHKLSFANDQIRKLLLNNKGYFHNGHHQCYKLQFKQLKNSLELILIYDIRQIKCVQYQSFKAISGFDGLLIQIEHQLVGSQKLIKNNNLAQEITIGIDYGHGGSDHGAIGLSAQPEKIITRQVGFRLKKILKNLGYKIVETCPEDLKMDLDERTYLINFAESVDLLISLHANHAANKDAMGLETFFGDDQLFKKIAQSSFTNLCEVNLLGNLSKKLADTIHKAVLQEVSDNLTHAYELKDRKVRCSAAQILMGVECPAILIELGYLSNAQEAKKLNEPEYQALLANGIAQGIKNYFAK